MAEYDLGRAHGRIIIDSDGATRGFREAGDEADAFQSKLSKASPALKKAGAAFIGVGAAALAGVGVAVKAAASFEKEISNFQAAAQETPEVLEQVRQKALQIGRDTSFGAGEAASAITNLSYAGLATADILNGAADAAVALAEAGELDIPQAASIMSASMNSFGIAAEDSMQVANTMIGVFANSDTMVDELGEALKNVSATAATAGVTLDDTAVALGLLADRGIKGGAAGTTLNRMLLNLLGATGPAKEAMKELGLITADGSNQFFTAEGKLKDLASVSDILQGSLKDLTQEQKLMYLESIFGSRALAAASTLADAGASGFNSLATEMQGVSAADVATEKLNNLSGALTILKGTIETALIAAGTPLLGILTAITRHVTELVNRFASLPPNVQKFIAIAVVVFGVLSTLVGVFLMILGFLPSIAKGFALFRTVLLPILGPIGLVIAILAALAVGFYLLWTRSEKFREIVTKVFAAVANFAKGAFRKAMEVVPKIFEAIVNFVQGAFRAAMEWLRDVWASIRPGVQAIGVELGKMVTKFGELITAITPFAQMVGRVLVGAFQKFWSIAQPILKFLVSLLLDSVKLAIEGVVQAFRGALQIINGILDVFIGIFTGNWSRVWEGIKGIFTGVWNFLVGAIKTYLAVGVLKAFGAAFKGLFALVRGSWSSIVNLFKGFFTGAKSTVRGGMDSIRLTIWRVMDGLKNFVRSIFQGIFNFIKFIINGIKNFVSAGFRGMLSLVKGILQAYWNYIKFIFNTVKNLIIGAIRAAKDFVLGAFRSLSSGARSTLNSLIEFVKGIPGKILNAFGSLGRMMLDLGKRAINSLVDGLHSVMGAVAAKASEIKNTIVSKLNPANWFSTPEEHYRMLWGDAFKSIADEARGNLPTISRAASAVRDEGARVVPPAIPSIKSAPATSSQPVGGFTQTVTIDKIEARDAYEALRAADSELGWAAQVAAPLLAKR